MPRPKVVLPSPEGTRECARIGTRISRQYHTERRGSSSDNKQRVALEPPISMHEGGWCQHLWILCQRDRDKVDPIRSRHGALFDEPPGCQNHDLGKMVFGCFSGLHPPPGSGMDKPIERGHDSQQLVLRRGRHEESGRKRPSDKGQGRNPTGEWRTEGSKPDAPSPLTEVGFSGAERSSMEGPPNIRGVGAEFYRRGNPLGQANFQPTDSHTSINQRRHLDDAKLVHPKRRQEGKQTGFEVAQRTTSLHGLGWEHGTVTPAILCEDIYSRTTIRGHRSQLSAVHGHVPVFIHTSTHVCTHRQLYSSTHTYRIRRRRPRSTTVEGKTTKREIADPSWSGKSGTHRSIILNRLCLSIPATKSIAY